MACAPAHQRGRVGITDGPLGALMAAFLVPCLQEIGSNAEARRSQ